MPYRGVAQHCRGLAGTRPELTWIRPGLAGPSLRRQSDRTSEPRSGYRQASLQIREIAYGLLNFLGAASGASDHEPSAVLDVFQHAEEVGEISRPLAQGDFDTAASSQVLDPVLRDHHPDLRSERADGFGG